MTKKNNPKNKVTNPKTKSEKKAEPQDSLSRPWMKMRTGLILVGIASLGMVILTAWQVAPILGLGQGILRGLVFGVLIWVIFWGLYFIRRLLR